MLRDLARYLLVAFMVSTGALHFIAESFFLQIVPPPLPWPLALVYLSGAIEITLGVLLLPERTRRLASYLLAALFVAVFPANIYMAVSNVQLVGMPEWFVQPSPLALWLRLPLQLVFIVWALQVGKSGPRHDAGAATPSA
jgi:uncharacterized membrane protein